MARLKKGQVPASEAACPPEVLDALIGRGRIFTSHHQQT
jgi:hypothetical protein